MFYHGLSEPTTNPTFFNPKLDSHAPSHPSAAPRSA